MGFFKKAHQPYMTDADHKRIADIDNNPALENRKCKFGITLKHPDIKAEIYIIVYGKDNDAIKEEIAKHLKFFKTADKRWELAKSEDLKKHDDDEIEDS